jgi:hypothetical protein
MRIASTLRFLSLPAAVALGAALAVACSDGAPTAPDPSFATRIVYEDDDGAGNCPRNYTPLTFDNSVPNATYDPYDTNDNGIICRRQIGGSNKKH